MPSEWIRKHCLSMPHATEMVQWEDHLLFKVGGKMFAVTALEPGRGNAMSFKTEPEEFAELIERPGVIPAPYLARSHWVALETESAIPRAELKVLLRKSYELVVAKLPKKTRDAFAKPTKPR
jgi:predicted DNA-binding protein (MmcQ/YjbR family)